MLEYTGHPLVDVGVATITAFANKRDPTQLTEADLDRIADYMAGEYVKQPLRSFLTVAFPNSGFTQPAYFKQPEKQQIYADHVLRAYEAETPVLDEACCFTGWPVANVSYDVKGELRPGYAFRQHVPLVTGEDVINFHPYGVAGLPLSGRAMLALQALPLGCAKCGGRLLAVHSDNNEITFHFAQSFLRENRRAIQLTQQAGGKKMPERQYSHRTLLVDTLIEAESMREERDDQELFSLTAYHLSNSGQGPKLDIYHLPLASIGFLRDMRRAEYREQWNAIVHRAWEVAPKKKGGKKRDKPFEPRRNWLYEDLFDLPDNAARFLRTYFLRIALRHATGKTDPRVSYSLQNEANLVSWKVTERFLWRILHMDKERIEQIRKMGDQLAEYIWSQNDRHFFAGFRTRNYYHFRTALLRANLAHVKRDNPPIIKFDPYVEVFEMAENDSRPDWSLARDLVFIRIIERLHELGWLGANVDVVPEVAEEETESA